MQVDPRHLVQFAAIVERQSFSGAAEALGTTQPALSRLVADLEQRLGVKLLAQRRRPVVPTALGRDLAEQGFVIRAAMADAGLLATGARSGERGLVRIGAPPFICDFALAKIIATYRGARPDVAFSVTAAYSDDIRRRIAHGQLDIGLGIAAAASERPRLRSEPLIQINHAIVCRRGHPVLNASIPASADLLRASEWISHASDSQLHAIMRDGLATMGVDKPNVIVQSDSAGAISTLVQASNGLTVLPVFAMLDAIEAGELAIVPAVAPFPSVHLSALTREVTAADPVGAAFLADLKRSFAALESRSLAVLERAGKNSLRKG